MNIPKAELLADPDDVAADALRPLTITAGEQLIALRINHILAPVAARTVAPPQRGFASDRQIADGLDGAMASLSLLLGARAAAVLFDFANAFSGVEPRLNIRSAQRYELSALANFHHPDVVRIAIPGGHAPLCAMLLMRHIVALRSLGSSRSRGGDYSAIVGTEATFHRGARVASAGDGTAEEVVDAALSSA